MNSILKSISIAIIFSGLFFSSTAQINLLSNSITFRDYYNPYNTTIHYGDLSLTGGSAGSGWGWLGAEAVRCWNWMNVYGALNVYGTKNFIHPHPTDTTKVIKYVAIESGEVLTLARGTAITSNGTAQITLPEHFSLVTSDSFPVTVIVTPE
jgi:hypothetical protein